MQDFGLVDLPYPLRRLSLNPLGTLRAQPDRGGYVFRRGADSLPSVGAPVRLPTEVQLRSIVESGERRGVKIGTSPLAGDAEVRVDPNRLFGRHLAVLGNTGSGKSCSVAGIIRWSLEQAQQARPEGVPNARFIILDPNGEYSRALGNDAAIKARLFKVNPGAGELALKVPLWFWNSAEWGSFTQASARTQRPLLRRALREVKAGRVGATQPTEEERKLALRRYLSSRLISIQRDLRSGVIQTDETKFGFRLKAISTDLEQRQVEFKDCQLGAIIEAIAEALKATYNSFVERGTGKTVEFYRAFSEAQIQKVVDALHACTDMLGGVVYQEGPDEDVPLPFSGADLADHLEILAEQENVSQFLDFLVARMRTFLSEPKMKAVIGDGDGMPLDMWLAEYVGGDGASNGSVSVIDLSLVPTEVVHVVTAVIARMVFEALQRYVKLNGVALPTVLVMEEAHTFIKRYKEDVENQDAAAVCCQVFERIAREGRKFGLGLVLSSQRPSELSPTVLSQCNTFLLHRISNDRDQELVQRLVPDNLKGLLRELPSLPSQSAILLGWASELPVLVRMNDLPKSQQPRSDDPEFWGVWVGRDDEGTPVLRAADWDRVAKDWQAGQSRAEDAEG
jgi:DNA helicase HerA-like ATPase